MSPGPLDAILEQLADHERRLADTAEGLAALAAQLEGPQQRGYQPAPTVPWWELDGRARDLPLARLRSWTRQVFIPGHGYLAAMLPDCWEQHDLCLYILDCLSELWNSLYLDATRTKRMTAEQAEFYTRLLPAACERFAAERAACQHGRRDWRTG